MNMIPAIDDRAAEVLTRLIRQQIEACGHTVIHQRFGGELHVGAVHQESGERFIARCDDEYRGIVELAGMVGVRLHDG